MQTVRLRILDFIKNHRSATAAEISQAFHMSKANARRHLMILVDEGVIQVVDEHPASGKGRPGRVFAVSESTLGDNFDILSSALLESIAALSEKVEPLQTYRAVAKRMAEKMISTINSREKSGFYTSSLTHRLNNLAKILNAAHYQSRWEAHRESPHLILGHCPYAAILNENPQLCDLDAEIIHSLAGQPVEQKARLVKDPSGFRYCVFSILP
jgi:predicted ArsR family transcriptional regulator